jgi:MATE family multidrug resistance protein
MSMAIVDTMMVGRLPNSAVAMGAVSLGSAIFIVLALFGEGLLLGLDTIVAQAFGAGKREDCHRSLVNGVYLSLALTPILSAPVFLMPFLLRAIHVDAALMSQTIPYTNALTWGLFPLLLYFAVRRCLQAMNMVRPVAFALVTANIVNALFNWILIYGKWGFRPMGTVGSGWSTAIARIYMAAVLIGYLFWYDRKHHTELLKTPVDIDLRRIKQLIALGIPAAVQFTLETGVFATVTTLIAKLGPVPLATHQIALNTVAFTYMVPLGISSAAAVRVGQALGRKDPRGAGAAGGTAIFIGAAFMTLAGIVLLVVPRWIARIYTTDETVIRNTAALLAAGAAFQLFDGIQSVATGALRGAGDTRTSMLANLGAYWFIGLPLAFTLGFKLGWGALGVWLGLCLGLIIIGSGLLFFWHKRKLTQLMPLPVEKL